MIGASGPGGKGGGTDGGGSGPGDEDDGDPATLGARARGIVPGTTIRIKAPWRGKPQYQTPARRSADVIPLARRQRSPHTAEKEAPMSTASAAPHPSRGGHEAAAGPQLPRADAPRAVFAGFEFASGETAPRTAGVFILACRIGAHYYPAFIGEGADMAGAAEVFRADNPVEAGILSRIFWMERAEARLRAHTLRDLVRKFDPPLNVEHRAGPAAPEIAALLGDRAPGLDDGAREQLSVEIHVTEADLDKLVKEFYAVASADPLLAPVFSHAIHDWEGHYQIVQNFWSRTLLGTSRYNGNPFSAHVMLKLTPEHFDRWVALFKATAERVLEPNAAARAIAKVEHMSTCFQAGLFLPPVGEGTPHA